MVFLLGMKQTCIALGNNNMEYNLLFLNGIQVYLSIMTQELRNELTGRQLKGK